jgi:hypothetical protein
LQSAAGQIRHEHIAGSVHRKTLGARQAGIGTRNDGTGGGITVAASRIDGDAAERGYASDKVRYIDLAVGVHRDTGWCGELGGRAGDHRGWCRVSITSRRIFSDGIGNVRGIDVEVAVQRDALRPGELRSRADDDRGWRSVAARRGRVDCYATGAARSAAEVCDIDIAGRVDGDRARGS